MSETCRCPWADVWRMEAIEFLTIICYAKDKAADRAAREQKWMREN